MNVISDSAIPWRTTTEVAVAPTPTPEADPSFGGDAAVDEGFRVFGNDGFTFLDFIDIINPLQHIPVIGTLYREFSGDEIDPGSRVLGGTLFFGPVGTVASLANVIIEDSTGKDLGEHVMALFEDENADKTPEAINAEGEPGPIATGRQVADTGAGSAAQPATVDPVTAWAVSEMAFRQSAAEKAESARPVAAPAPIVGALDSRPTGRFTGWQNAAALSAGIPSAATARDAIRAADDDARQRAYLMAVNSYAPGRPASRADGARARATEAPTPTPPPSGAIAANGGWFSDTMISALGRYEDAAVAGGKRAAAIDLSR